MEEALKAARNAWLWLIGLTAATAYLGISAINAEAFDRAVDGLSHVLDRLKIDPETGKSDAEQEIIDRVFLEEPPFWSSPFDQMPVGDPANIIIAAPLPVPNADAAVDPIITAVFSQTRVLYFTPPEEVTLDDDYNIAARGDDLYQVTWIHADGREVPLSVRETQGPSLQDLEPLRSTNSRALSELVRRRHLVQGMTVNEAIRALRVRAEQAVGQLSFFGVSIPTALAKAASPLALITALGLLAAHLKSVLSRAARNRNRSQPSYTWIALYRDHHTTVIVDALLLLGPAAALTFFAYQSGALFDAYFAFDRHRIIGAHPNTFIVITSFLLAAIMIAPGAVCVLRLHRLRRHLRIRYRGL
ncbi:MAG: hypothetical protein AAGJ54_03705 [Planctomycetota bacterium]